MSFKSYQRVLVGLLNSLNLVLGHMVQIYIYIFFYFVSKFCTFIMIVKMMLKQWAAMEEKECNCLHSFFLHSGKFKKHSLINDVSI